METKHTPGPWDYAPIYNGAGTEIEKFIVFYSEELSNPHNGEYEGERSIPVCFCINENDAKLIAAAPDLLEALINLQKSHANLYSKLSPNWKKEIIDYAEIPSVKLTNAAIKKATE